MEHRHSSLPSPYPDPIKNPHSLIIDVAVRLVVGAGKHVPRPGLVSWSIIWLSSPSRGNNESRMKWRMTYPWLQIICNRTRGHGGQQCWIGPKQNKSKNGNDNKDLTFLEWIDFLKYLQNMSFSWYALLAGKRNNEMGDISLAPRGAVSAKGPCPMMSPDGHNHCSVV